MEFDTVLKKRKSTRNFKKKIASWRDALDAIDSALEGPYASNHNNLYFIIIEDEKTIKQVANLSQQAWIAETGLLIAVCSDDTRLENLHGERGRVYSRQQAGAAIGTILLKLTDLGLDSCWVGAYADDVLKQTLKIPQHIQVEAIIPIGYALKKEKRPEKKRLEASIFWEVWDKWKRPALFKETKKHPL